MVYQAGSAETRELRGRSATGGKALVFGSNVAADLVECFCKEG
jgi:hypothetical protein